jgi:TRAP-type C4-dicarboxylate transport system permease small subunit
MITAFFRRISKIENAVMATLLGFNLTILFVAIVMRYLFNSPPCWPEEASRYLMIWIVYLGASLSIEKNSEIKIDILPILIPSKCLKIFTSIFAHFIGLIISALLTFLAIQFVGILIESEQNAASFPISMSLIYIIIPISCALMGIKYTLRLIAIFREWRVLPARRS